MPSPQHKKQSSQVRPRSVPFPRPLIHATFLGSLFLISAICLMIGTGIYMASHSRPAAILVISTLIATPLLWIISLLKRRSARCPLCRGTPYLDSGAHKHVKATKLPMFNFGTSNLLRTIFTHTFRCMFCGQLFDFHKKASRTTATGRRG